MLDVTAEGRVSHVLTNLGEALAAGDLDRALALFQDDCYWRDLVSFTWNIKTVEGKDTVRGMLKAQLPSVKPSDWTVDSGAGVSDENGVTTGWFTFETDAARGYGLVRLKDGKIWTLLTTAAELKGHEEPVGFQRPLGAKHGAGKHRLTWKEEREEEARTLGFTKQPYVVIVGGGQGAIGLGARLRMLDVPTIIVEKNSRPGDSWRNRYKSLCLHDPVWYDHMPYLPFPPNWPVFSPKDKIGDWLEMYTRIMELNYWGSTTCKKASYDEPLSSSATARRSHCGQNISSLRPGCRPNPTFRISPAWRASRATSTTRQSIRVRTPMLARRRSSSARTTPPTTSRRRCGRTTPT
jgi:putative flavoprotein involved in K+ transport